MPNFYTTTTHSVARKTVFTHWKYHADKCWVNEQPSLQPDDYKNILCLGIVYKDEQGRDISLFKCWDNDPTKYIEYYGIQGNELYEDLIV